MAGIRVPAPSSFRLAARRLTGLLMAIASFATVGVILPIAGAPPASAAAGDIFTFAGGPGNGVALATGIAPNRVLATAGGALISDSAWEGIRKVTGANISIVAGNGAFAHGADGPDAKATEMWFPDDMVVDVIGNIYVADRINSRVRKITPGGAISTYAGTGFPGDTGDNGPATAAALRQPSGLAMDAGGNLYVADAQSHRVRKVSPGGTITAFAGSGVEGFAGDGGPPTLAKLDSPSDVEIGPGGSILIADKGNHRIRSVSGAQITTFAGNGTPGYSGDGLLAGAAQLNAPNAIEYSGSALYIADTGNSRIRAVTLGIMATFAGGGSGTEGPRTSVWMSNPSGLSMNAAGELFVVGYCYLRRIGTGGLVTQLAGNFTTGSSGDGGPASSAQIDAPNGVALGADGSIFIAESWTGRIRKRTTDGKITTVAGGGIEDGLDGAPVDADDLDLDYPNDVAIDLAGNLFVAEMGHNLIRKITPAGVATIVAGNGEPGSSGDGGPATLARLHGPRGLDVATDGTIYIADTYGHRVRKVTTDGTIDTIAGTGSSGFSGDGGSGKLAKLDEPNAVLADGAGGVLVADTENHRIRRIAPDGKISTVAGDGAEAFKGDGGPALAASIYAPSSLALDDVGNLFVGTGERVRRITPGGTNIATIAGTGTAGYSGEYGPATAARMGTPEDLLVTPVGDLVLADAVGQRLRRVVGVATAGARYHALSPSRILDSRDGTGGDGTKWGALTTRDVKVTGVGGVPATGATSVVLNVTVTGGTASSHLTVFPAGQSMPTASNLNWPAGDTRPNLVTAKVGAGGKVSIFNNAGSVHVIADVVGWYDDGAILTGERFSPLSPVRILDSRENIGGYSLPWNKAMTRDVKVRGVGGVPDAATAVVLNVTAVNTTDDSHLTVWPAGQSMPVASNLNWPQGAVRANVVIAKVGAAGKVSIFNNAGWTDVIADVVGYFAPDGQAFHGVAPYRELDSRDGTGGFSTPFVQTPRGVRVAGVGPVPSGAKAVVLNVTVTGGTAGSHLTVWPYDESMPTASNLNWSAGQTVANLVVVKVGLDGKVAMRNNTGAAHVIADVVGYYL